MPGGKDSFEKVTIMKYFTLDVDHNSNEQGFMVRF